MIKEIKKLSNVELWREICQRLGWEFRQNRPMNDWIFFLPDSRITYLAEYDTNNLNLIHKVEQIVIQPDDNYPSYYCALMRAEHPNSIIYDDADIFSSFGRIEHLEAMLSDGRTRADAILYLLRDKNYMNGKAGQKQ